MSDWSSDVCSSDLPAQPPNHEACLRRQECDGRKRSKVRRSHATFSAPCGTTPDLPDRTPWTRLRRNRRPGSAECRRSVPPIPGHGKSEEHTSELQSLMRNSYAVFCLTKKNKQQN